MPNDTAILTSLDELIALAPSLVVECAGHQAVRDNGVAILAAGIDLMIVSTGALAEPDVLDTLNEAATKSGSRISIPAGAVAGLDGLTALKVAGLTRVRYTSTKPPQAWRGTIAEKSFDLTKISEPTILFEGAAREAALKFPKNANIAATVALAGLGLDQTVIRLVADPAATGNSATLEAQSHIGSLTATMIAHPSDNPKTSATTAYSLVHAIQSRTATVVI